MPRRCSTASLAALKSPPSTPTVCASCTATTKRWRRSAIHTPFVIFDRNDTKSVLKRAMNELNIDEKKLSVADALDMISNAKTKANPVSREPKGSRALGARSTIRTRTRSRRRGALDFDDLMVLPLHILATDKDVLERERARLDWVLVDEYQDVNMPQYLLLRCLVEGGRKIMVVGDPDQSIYGWRGAEMAMILNFERDFKGSKVTVARPELPLDRQHPRRRERRHTQQRRPPSEGFVDSLRPRAENSGEALPQGLRRGRVDSEEHRSSSRRGLQLRRNCQYSTV